MPSPASANAWQYHIERDGCQYRVNIDEARATSLGKTSAEYFNEKYQQWREVKNINTRHWLYRHIEQGNQT